jgi:plastocyanin
LKKLIALAATGSAVAALAIPALAATTKTVKLGDDWFVRKGSSTPMVTIKKGDTVKWVWSGKARHNVYQVGGPGHFHSPTHAKTGTFKHRFTVRGTYVFQCTYHLPMKMKVKVS